MFPASFCWGTVIIDNEDILLDILYIKPSFLMFLFYRRRRQGLKKLFWKPYKIMFFDKFLSAIGDGAYKF